MTSAFDIKCWCGPSNGLLFRPLWCLWWQRSAEGVGDGAKCKSRMHSRQLAASFLLRGLADNRRKLVALPQRTRTSTYRLVVLSCEYYLIKCNLMFLVRTLLRTRMWRR